MQVENISVAPTFQGLLTGYLGDQPSAPCSDRTALLFPLHLKPHPSKHPKSE